MDARDAEKERKFKFLPPFLPLECVCACLPLSLASLRLGTRSSQSLTLTHSISVARLHITEVYVWPGVGSVLTA